VAWEDPFEISRFFDRDPRPFRGGEPQKLTHTRPIDSDASAGDDLQLESADVEEAVERCEPGRRLAIFDQGDRGL
jgi:hypothetical protein